MITDIIKQMLCKHNYETKEQVAYKHYFLDNGDRGYVYMYKFQDISKCTRCDKVKITTGQ